jgi:hypothetical protein
MEGIIPIAIWAVIILIGLGLLAIALFGVRGVIYGKIQPLSIAIVIIPVALLLVLGLSMEDWGQAGIITLLIMLGLAAFSLLLSGLRTMLGL